MIYVFIYMRKMDVYLNSIPLQVIFKLHEKKKKTWLQRLFFVIKIRLEQIKLKAWRLNAARRSLVHVFRIVRSVVENLCVCVRVRARIRVWRRRRVVLLLTLVFEI
jgi:hypothetical protein